MTETTQAQTGTTPVKTECKVDPADQPKLPGTCAEIESGPPEPTWTPPTVDCQPPACCPQDPPASATCLDPLIEEQLKEITKAEQAKAFKTELEGLQQKTKTAKLDYTDAKYLALLERWKKEDGDIVEILPKLTCALKCWREQIQCFVCPLLYDIQIASRSLNGKAGPFPGKNYSPFARVFALPDAEKSLYDVQYWRQRNRAAKQAAFDRVKAVLAAWEKPGTTIDKVLSDNTALLQTIRTSLGAKDAGKLIYDLFLRVIPMHLLIAPPKETFTTGIDKKYVADLCPCDGGIGDACCGSDAGVPGVLADLLGPQPFLLKPSDYDAVVCCLVQKRYLPAKKALADADADLQATNNLITATLAAIADKKKSIEALAKAKLAQPFDCCSGEGGTGSSPGKTGCGCTGTKAPPAAAPAPTEAPAPAQVA